MTVNELFEMLNERPQDVSFDKVIATIDAHFHYTPTRFVNGEGADTVINEAGQNEGSCKIFAFADMYDLNEAHTLACFGKYYREGVLRNLGGTDHANIRSFLRHGWPGIEFDGPALRER